MNTTTTIDPGKIQSRSNRPAGFGDVRDRPKKRSAEQIAKEKQAAQDRRKEAQEKRQRMLIALDKGNGYTKGYGPLRARHCCPARALAAQIVGIKYRPIYAPRSNRHIEDAIELEGRIEKGLPQSSLLRSRVSNVPVSWELEGVFDDRREAQQA